MFPVVCQASKSRVDHVLMGDEDPFGSARRTRGVNDIRQVLGSDAAAWSLLLLLPDDLPVGIQTDDLCALCWQPADQFMLRHHYTHLGILQHKSLSLPWLSWVQGHIGSPCLQNSRHARAQLV